MKFLLLMMLTTAALAAPAIPILPCEPDIDGRPGDPAWEAAVCQTDFRSTQEYSSPYQAKVWYGRNQTHFFAAFRCEHGDVANIVQKCREKDSAVYFDDCVEVFFDATGQRQDYYQILANVQGAIYDQYVDRHGRNIISWDSDARAAGSILEGEFYLELSIPLASLNFAGNRSGEIGLALCRTLNYYKDWKYVYGKYHQIDTWTRFALPVQLPLSLEDFQGSRFGGQHNWRFTVKNTLPQPLTLTGSFQASGEQELPLQLSLPAGQSQELTFAVQQPPGIRTEIRLLLQNRAEQREVLRFYRAFIPEKLLDAIPLSTVLYRGEDFQAEVYINEAPDAPLQTQVLTPDRRVIREQKFQPDQRRSHISLPLGADLRQAIIILQYKGSSQDVKITTVDSPWR
ncbi:MAG: hypothetical protein GX564_07465 [Oligosphaeraceae bacterium]|nr:hypothetical protein [Oligosphaeraceae bacterium]